jgi:tRNA-2-methylthio-N6-dimethylallyladenosine synthase
VRLRRGSQRSRAIDEIAAEVKGLVGRGAREITLLGQNVDAYGTDFSGGPDLADVLFAVHEIEGLWRIRFLTSHPTDMTQRIIDTVAALPKVCPCWELAVQSGDDDVLRRMGRDYTVSRFRDLVRRIREVTPDCAINTDVIVGFSGETAEQFEHTRQLVEETRFDLVHVAAYSVRGGTPAARWKDDVSPAEKERRRLAIEGLQTEIASEINAAFLGRELEILVDGRQRGRWRGRTRTNKLVFFESDGDWLGRMVRVRICWTGPWSMLGEVVPPSQA